MDDLPTPPLPERTWWGNLLVGVERRVRERLKAEYQNNVLDVFEGHDGIFELFSTEIS